ARLLDDRRPAAERRERTLAGRARTERRRTEHAIGRRTLLLQPRPGPIGLDLAGRAQATPTVIVAGRARFGVRVTQQDQLSDHRGASRSIRARPRGFDHAPGDASGANDSARCGRIGPTAQGFLVSFRAFHLRIAAGTSHLDKRYLRIGVALAIAVGVIVAQRVLREHATAPADGPVPIATPETGGFTLGSLAFTSCELAQPHSGATTAAWCAPFQVPEDWDAPEGRHIDLKLALVRSDA